MEKGIKIFIVLVALDASYEVARLLWQGIPYTYKMEELVAIAVFFDVFAAAIIGQWLWKKIW